MDLVFNNLTLAKHFRGIKVSHIFTQLEIFVPDSCPVSEVPFHEAIWWSMFLIMIALRSVSVIVVCHDSSL